MSIDVAQLNGTPSGAEKEPTQTSFVDKANNFLLKFSSVPLKEKLFFVQYLSIMIKSGISLSAALGTLSKQTENKRFKMVLTDISAIVEKGVNFTDALRHHEKVFGELFINMIEAGELSGKLEEVLAQLYIQMKKRNELISKVKGALTYPAVILMAMGGIGTFMMVVIVPKMLEMFKGFNADLPLATKILIKFSNALSTNGPLVLVSFVIFVLIAVKVLSTYRGKYIFQAVILHLPVFGPIVKKINLAGFARTISSLMKTDIMIIKSLQITANVLGNLHYREAILDIAEKIKKGGQISAALIEHPKLFPPVVNQIVAVGEDTGELDNILAELADFYESEVDKIMENLPAIIEPILILFLGLGVGGVAVAIIMPMYSLTSAV